MTTRLRLALVRFLAFLLATGFGDAVVQFVTDNRYDWRHLLGLLLASAVLAFEQYYKSGKLISDLGLDPSGVGDHLDPFSPPQSPVVTTSAPIMSSAPTMPPQPPVNTTSLAP